jgi:hypothetical protein
MSDLFTLSIFSSSSGQWLHITQHHSPAELRAVSGAGQQVVRLTAELGDVLE